MTGLPVTASTISPPVPDAARLAARQRLILHLDRAVTRATLIAPAEGNTRFAGAATCTADLPNLGATTLREYLSHQTGEAIREADAAIISRPPLRLLVIGTPQPEDEIALGTIATFGIARITERITPPHGPERELRWAATLIERMARREADALALHIGPGPFAGWTARLFNAISALPRHRQPRGLVRGLPPELSDLVPDSVALIPSGGDAAEAYTHALTRVVASRLALNPLPPTVLFRVPALVTALVAAERVIGTSVLYMDVSDGTTLILTEGGRARVFRDAEVDAGAGAATLLAQVDEERIRRWLPFPMSAAALRGWAVRRAAFPAAMPLVPHDRILTAAFARESLRTLAAQVGPAIEASGMCILGPGTGAWGTPGQTLLAVMDTVSLAGPTPIASDTDDLLPVIGWLARENPESAAALFTHDALTPLGTAVPVFGTGGAKETALRVALTEPAQADTQAVSVQWGTLLRLPVPDGPANLSTLGRGDRDFQAVAVQGGTGGILIDGRGRPLLTAQSREEQHERVRQWFAMLDPRGTPR